MKSTASSLKNTLILLENNYHEGGIVLEPVYLTDETINGFGHILHTSSKAPSFDNEQFTFTGDVLKFAAEGNMTAGILVGHKREFKPESLEKHMKTVEILVQLENDAVIYLANATESDEPRDIKSFFFKQGEAISLSPGTWHWVPYPHKDDHCKTLVIFKENTSAEDCVIKNV